MIEVFLGDMNHQAQVGEDQSVAGVIDMARSCLLEEARQAADQWLRRIPDDPAGLVQRKFL